MNDPSVDREIAAAAAWMRSEAVRLPFGTVGVSLTLHRGSVTRVDRTSSASLKPGTGDSNGAER